MLTEQLKEKFNYYNALIKKLMMAPIPANKIDQDKILLSLLGSLTGIVNLQEYIFIEDKHQNALQYLQRQSEQLINDVRTKIVNIFNQQVDNLKLGFDEQNILNNYLWKQLENQNIAVIQCLLLCKNARMENTILENIRIFFGMDVNSFGVLHNLINSLVKQIVDSKIICTKQSPAHLAKKLSLQVINQQQFPDSFFKALPYTQSELDKINEIKDIMFSHSI
ncbi:MAG: hypothetical protein Tsb005_07860 [Gammaproteobacteria bacterium]